MSNKLEEMKRRLLEQQLAKDKNNNQTAEVKNIHSDSPVNIKSNDNVPNDTSNKIQEISEIVQNSPKEQEANSVSPISPIKNSNADINVESQPKQEIVKIVQIVPVEKAIIANSSPSPIIEEKHSEQIAASNKVEQQIISKGKQEVVNNLDLVDKHPNISCSIDEEVAVPSAAIIQQPQKQNQSYQNQSKQQKKQKKIVLKELIMIKECVKNLQSAVKGLQILQNKMKVDPSLRPRVRQYLKQIDFAFDDN